MVTTPVPVAKLDLNRYLGTWYEQAHSPVPFEPEEAINVTAKYSLLPNGLIHVLNEMELEPGQKIPIRGFAYRNTDEEAKLCVSFPNRPPADYWVVLLDSNYKWAVVSNPHHYVSILTRDSQPDPNLVDWLVWRLATEQGFTPEEILKLIPVRHIHKNQMEV